MKTTPLKCALAAVVLLSTLNSQLSTLFAQGSLTPPGAPAPTMKTLDQTEPRTPISSAPFAITRPGSYYLTTNLTVTNGDAITIATNGVTLDLRGFTIFSTAPSATGSGILLWEGLSDITILNGHIRGGVTNNAGTYNGPGFLCGISCYPDPAPMNVRVAGVSVSGCLSYGIYLLTGEPTVADSCTVRTVGGSGIVASTIKGSLAVDCGYIAIFGDQVSDSRGQCTGTGNALSAATALNCYGLSYSGSGLYTSTALNCYGYSVSGTGLSATTALNCCGSSYSGTGLYAAHTAIGCRGSSSSGTGLSAYIANSCSATSVSATYKYDMP